MKTKRISFERETFEKLEALASNEGKTVEQLVTETITDHCK